MNTQSEIKDLLKTISDYQACIVYNPLESEINFDTTEFPINLPNSTITLPADKEADPFYWAKFCNTELKDKSVFLLIPGTKFDMYGTRIGKGGGWYDRFLLKAPKEWLKIGITNSDNFSENKLTRMVWDKSVDWVLVLDPHTSLWTACKAKL